MRDATDATLVPTRRALPDGPAPAGPGHHPHLAVRHGGRARTSSTARCRGARGDQRLDPRPRPQEDGKSKGNAVTPEDVVEEHGADAVRYWAASARLGTDAAFDTGQMKIGRRLAIKVLNASKFALGFGDVAGEPALTARRRIPLDLSMLAGLADVVDKATAALRGVRLHPRARGHRDVLLDVLRRLPRARQGPRLRRPGRRRRPRAPGPRCALALDDAAAPARPVPPVRDRGGLVVVAGRARCTAQSWPTRDELPPSAGTPALARVASARPSPGCAR